MQPQLPWQLATEPTPLTADEVHVWRIGLEVNDALLARFRETLSDDERQRASRFHFEIHRRHFIAGRGAMRALLARYMKRLPDELRFVYSTHGKPALLDEANGHPLRFNLSHSHNLALLAVTQGRAIGVDVEHMRANLERDGETLAERFFSPREVIVLKSLPPKLRREAFFHCWTRKEAYIKAQGQGLSLPLDQFDVTLHPDETAALIATLYDPPQAQRWSMHRLDPGEEYVGALVVEGQNCRLWCGDWDARAT